MSALYDYMIGSRFWFPGWVRSRSKNSTNLKIELKSMGLWFSDSKPNYKHDRNEPIRFNKIRLVRFLNPSCLLCTPSYNTRFDKFDTHTKVPIKSSLDNENQGYVKIMISKDSELLMNCWSCNNMKIITHFWVSSNHTKSPLSLSLSHQAIRLKESAIL